MNMLSLPVGPLQANCYLVWSEDNLAYAVDPGGEPEKIVEAVRRKALRLEAILITHGHFDHVEGVAGLARDTGAMVYCSELVVPVLVGAQGCSATGLAVPALNREDASVVHDGSLVEFDGLVAKVIATPGHTPGDVTYDIGGALFCGDLLFRGSVGRTDFPGGDFGQLIASVRRLVDQYPAETRVYPGHMEPTSLGQELRHNPFLTELRSDG